MAQAGRITHITIIGGGTAGWMTAAGLAKMLSRDYTVQLVESEEIGTVGVGEATIPLIKLFNNALELDEADFIRKTNGSFKLGIEFINWGKLGARYIHGFGKIGVDMGLVPFHHFWLRMKQQGKVAPLDEYSINTWAALHDRFLPPDASKPGSPLADIAYAFHFDAGLYARYLREFSEALGVKRIEGKIVDVTLDGESGDVQSVTLESGQVVGGQLFIDCSGFRGLLIEQTLKSGFEDWSHWLPCDRAAAVPSAHGASIAPFTRSTAHGAGWQWRIPLQHRVGNGHVFCSQYTSEDEAIATLLANLEGEALAEPRVLRFKAGKRRKFWNRNVVAIGLASGFMEPLESTSIHLVQTAIAKLSAFFPANGIDQADVDEFNRHCDLEYDNIRDFLIAHYNVTSRDDTPFWNYCRTMSIPETLQRKLDVFAANGRVFREGNELFAEPSWIQCLYGQGLHPRGYHGLADTYPQEVVADYLENIRMVIDNCLKVMPTHEQYIARTCAAPRM